MPERIEMNRCEIERDIEEYAIDRILSRNFSNAGSNKNILPSSGFAASVMDTVQREAATPPSIPFPWKIFLPGLVASLVLLVAGIVSVARSGSEQTNLQSAYVSLLADKWIAMLTQVFQHSVEMGVGWVLLALLLSYATAELSFSLVD